ncbi:nitroreductase family protein [Desulfonatronovibrio magnus]|uniref:nitroreductase family protein n=1 Tax=Desulfonatronovibrio magnus TaxID=698827 RepID=UPI0005EBC606|nr:nitroreductase family protein [Desulfonatronovibrio magnus]
MLSIAKNIYRLSFQSLKILMYYLNDAKKYYFSAIFPRKKYRRIEGIIIKLTHSMEKRLSFENRDPSFGKEKAFKLISLLESGLKDSNSKVSSTIACWSISTLNEFSKTFMEKNEQIEFLKRLTSISKLLINHINPTEIQGGIFELTRDEILTSSKDNYEYFSKNRHSIRNFAGPARIEIIKQSISLAQKCPSTCNIQPVRVYLTEDEKTLNSILSIQRGNKGFTEKIPQLLVFTADLSLYSGFRERNQCYVDGGIFSLSAAYALHFNGVGSCFLNWASSRKEDVRLREILNIPENEVVIVLLAIGNLSEKISIPLSKRRPMDEIFKVV